MVSCLPTLHGRLTLNRALSFKEVPFYVDLVMVLSPGLAAKGNMVNLSVVGHWPVFPRILCLAWYEDSGTG